MDNLTEKELSQLYYMNREVEHLLREKERLETLAGYRSPQLSFAPGGGGVPVVEGYLADAADIAKRIDSHLARIQRERAKLEQFINGIEDSGTRLIFRLRHVNGMTWEAIGLDIGYSREGVRKRYLKELQKLRSNYDIL